MLMATVALGLMCLAGTISIRAVRRRLRRETWWLVHLYMYLALALSFAHVIVLGPSFVGHPLTQLVWSAAWLATAGLVLCYRFGLPIVRSLRHRLQVVEVRREGPDVTSVIVGGRRLDRLAVSGGQFFFWRFLTRDMWWQAHPYSISALPRPPYLRLTVKAVGDHSAALARLRPGTAVAIEGPYGAFTRHAQRRPRALLVAAGIGVTALRSLLEDLPPRSAPVVILRASREADLVLRAEVSELVKSRRGTLHELVGNRERASVNERTIAIWFPTWPTATCSSAVPRDSWRASSARQEPRGSQRVHPSRGVRAVSAGSPKLRPPRGILSHRTRSRAHEAGAIVRHRRNHRRVRGDALVSHPSRGAGGAARRLQPRDGRRAPAKRAGAAPGKHKAKLKGAGAAAGSVQSAVGATEQYGYGELAVKVTASGSHITDVAVTTLQTAEPYSQQLASQVIPTLRAEVLSGQSAQINGVSGATYTSQAYAMSLQAALDKLHIR